MAFRFLIDKNRQKYFDKNNISLVMGSDCHLVAYPVDLNNLNIVMIARAKEENLQKFQESSYIKSFLNNSILKDYPEVINFENNDFKFWPIYFSKKPQLPILKNVFYLGDAFYAFPPTMAQGASQSIEASMELFEILQSNKSEKEKEYFENRLKRSEMIIKRSKFNYFAFHLKSNFFIWFREIILKRAIKNKNFIDSYLGRVFNK
jgi:salicylate hydroxylase